MKFIKMLFTSEMLKSLLFFFKLLFRKRCYDVVFFNSVVFNRGAEGENLLFKPFFEVCDELNLEYIIIEDADLKGEYNKFDRNKDAIPFDFISLVSIILRKFFNKKLEKLNSFEKEKFIGKFLQKYLLFNLDSKIYITLIWNKVTLWRLLNPHATIVDYQHGIIMNGNKGYLVNGKPPMIKRSNKITTLVFSNMIKEILITNDTTNFYKQDNVIALGVNNFFAKENGNNKSKAVLFSLQITPDFNKEINTNYVDILRRLINDNAKYFEENEYDLVLKHHPRYSENFDINFKYSFVNISDDNTYNLLSKSRIHITFYSTTAIDAALLGIPTIFIDLKKEFSPKEIFLNQFKYPFKNLLIHKNIDLSAAIDFIERDYQQISNKVFEWAKKLNNDFDKKKLKDFLIKKLN
jgi:hypothetical protein